jgi:hypothetical protein
VLYKCNYITYSVTIMFGFNFSDTFSNEAGEQGTRRPSPQEVGMALAIMGGVLITTCLTCRNAITAIKFCYERYNRQAPSTELTVITDPEVTPVRNNIPDMPLYA